MSLVAPWYLEAQRPKEAACLMKGGVIGPADRKAPLRFSGRLDPGLGQRQKVPSLDHGLSSRPRRKTQANGAGQLANKPRCQSQVSSSARGTCRFFAGTTSTI